MENTVNSHYSTPSTESCSADNMPKTSFADEIQRVKKKLQMRYPKVVLSNDILIEAYNYEKIGVDLLSSDVYLSQYHNSYKLETTIGVARKLARACIGHYSLRFAFIIEKKGKDGENDELIERAYFSDKEEKDLQGCIATIDYYHNANKYTVSGYSRLSEYYKKNKDASKMNLWDSKKTEMLKKSAEASGLRRVVSGLDQKYIKEELFDFSFLPENKCTDVTPRSSGFSHITPATTPVETIDLEIDIELSDEQYKKISDLQRKLGYSQIRTKEEMIRWFTYSYKGGEPKKYYDFLQKKLAEKLAENVGE